MEILLINQWFSHNFSFIDISKQLVHRSSDMQHSTLYKFIFFGIGFNLILEHDTNKKEKLQNLSK